MAERCRDPVGAPSFLGQCAADCTPWPGVARPQYPKRAAVAPVMARMSATSAGPKGGW